MKARGAITVAIAALASFLSPGCRSIAGRSQDPVEISVEIQHLERSEDASFRYVGTGSYRPPLHLSNVNLSLFIVSFGTDIRGLSTLKVLLTADELDRAINPTPDPWTGFGGFPQLNLEYSGGKATPIATVAYESTPILVKGRVRRYLIQEDPESFKFMWDVLFHGDTAEFEVTEPEQYAGTILHILVFDQDNAPSDNDAWRTDGQVAQFETVEETLMGEPWGFVPITQLVGLQFLSSEPIEHGR